MELQNARDSQAVKEPEPDSGPPAKRTRGRVARPVQVARASARAARTKSLPLPKPKLRQIPDNVSPRGSPRVRTRLSGPRNSEIWGHGDAAAFLAELDRDLGFVARNGPVALKAKGPAAANPSIPIIRAAPPANQPLARPPEPPAIPIPNPPRALDPISNPPAASNPAPSKPIAITIHDSDSDDESSPLARQKIARSVKEMGFPLSKINKAIDRLSNNGNGMAVTVQSVLDALTSLQAPSSPPAPPPPPPPPIEKPEFLCTICFESEPTHALVPCGHWILCGTCVKLEMGECPLCRTKKEGVLRIYKAI